MRSPEKFAIDLAKFAKTIEVDLQKVVKKISMDVFRGIVNKTPVDTGSARASWMISVDSPASAEVRIKTGKGNKSAVNAEAQQQLSKLNDITSFSYVNISNNLPYIAKLEYGGYPAGPKVSGGFSKQAPNGMLGVTMQEVVNSMLGKL